MDPKRIATETLAAFDAGSYTSPNGVHVELSTLLGACLESTRQYQPEDLAALMAQTPPRLAAGAATSFAVSPETSLQGAARLTLSGGYQRIGVLNFASARNPGGGVLSGARAQEESLARSSALYLSLLRCPEFYAFHRSLDTCIYSDRMIFSPHCPVVRDDAGQWLSAPYLVDFITSAAPNAGAIMRNEVHNRSQIGPILRERAAKVLALAAHQQIDALVLGAWGCGAFQNDARLVATAFYEHLCPQGKYANCFGYVLFAIRDATRERNVYNAFSNVLGPLL
jgi:uncharacterized protein (TIGR02452 family)